MIVNDTGAALEYDTHPLQIWNSVYEHMLCLSRIIKNTYRQVLPTTQMHIEIT